VFPHLPTSAADGLPGRVLVLRDLDDLRPEEVGRWFCRKLQDELDRRHAAVTPALTCAVEGNPRLALIEVSTGSRVGRVAIIAVGIPEDAAENHGIAQFAIDDYVLRLVRDRGTYEAVQQAETKSDFGTIPYDIALHKLTEVVKLLRENGIPIRHTKRLVQVLRGITDFRASNTTFGERFAKKALEKLARADAQSLLQPLLGDLEAAMRVLAGPPGEATSA
jgi:hypothetical protein